MKISFDDDDTYALKLMTLRPLVTRRHLVRLLLTDGTHVLGAIDGSTEKDLLMSDGLDVPWSAITEILITSTLLNRFDVIDSKITLLKDQV